MADLKSQDIDPVGHDLQDYPRNNDALTVIGPSQAQTSISTFEWCFTTMYPVQASIMSNLNRLDFKNLLLAGIRTPISQELRRKHLIPSKCDELIPGTRTACSNTTQNVDEIKICHGWHYDWNEQGLCKHAPGSPDGFCSLPTSNDNKGGHFDSFNVCIHCRDRDRLSRSENEKSVIGTFHKKLCKTHCLEHGKKRPHNTCHCKMFLDNYWRCHGCSLTDLETLKFRALIMSEQIFKKGKLQSSEICPIRGCTNPPWHSGPSHSHEQMFFCCACTAIFPKGDPLIR